MRFRVLVRLLSGEYSVGWKLDYFPRAEQIVSDDAANSAIEAAIDLQLMDAKWEVRKIGVAMTVPQYGPRIYGYSIKASRDHIPGLTATDIYQETFKRFTQRVKTAPLPDPPCVIQRLILTARNYVIDVWRRRGRERIGRLADGNQIPARRGNPVDERELQELILEGMAMLPNLEREALSMWLFGWGDTEKSPSVADAAVRLYGESTTEEEKTRKKNAFRSRRNAALNKLRDFLERMGYWPYE